MSRCVINSNPTSIRSGVPHADSHLSKESFGRPSDETGVMIVRLMTAIALSGR